MNIIKSLVIWTTIIFVVITFSTMTLDAGNDGMDSFGYPYTYYDYFGGKCGDCYHDYGLKPYYLLLDILFAGAFGILATIIQRQIIHSYNNRPYV